MRLLLASRIMPRTTVDLDASVLKELKRRRQEEGKSLGTLISEIVAAAFRGEAPAPDAQPLSWQTQAMGARIDLEDKDALHDALDAP